MSTTAPSQTAAVKPLQSTSAHLVLQRKCACGAGASALKSECAECSNKKMVGLQTKLRVNEPGDAYEQEADRVAEQVSAKPAHADVSGAPQRIQRLSGQSSGRIGATPPSVERVLASPGRPLEPALRQDMEQRFGHDFSRVRVHSGGVAEQSALEVNAHAYTVGHNIVFGAGRFAPETQDGRRLIAHELTHVVQQSAISHAGTAASMHGAPVLQRQPAKGRPAPAAAVAWTEVEELAYTNIVAAQNVLDELLADIDKKKVKFDDERINDSLARAIVYLREAKRTSAPIDKHAKLQAAMASLSRASESVGAYVVLLPRSPANEQARSFLEILHGLESSMTPVEHPPPQPPRQQVTDLRQDMERQVDNWKEACRVGISEFVHAELSSQIDALSEGNWKNFFQALVGNTVWAAAAFVPAGRPAFALSMAGIAIASAPTVPQKGTSKGALARIEDQLHTYIEKVHEKLNKQLPTSAAKLLIQHPEVSLEEGLKLFLEASFKPSMIKHNPVMIDETAVRQKMRESAAYSLALLREVSKVEGVTGAIHTSVAWLSPPNYGDDKKLAVVVSAPIGSGASVKFLRWVPEENEELALMTQRSQPIGVMWYLFEQQAPSDDPLYLEWLRRHGWAPEDGFGLEWFKRREERRAKAAR
jgi:hypothetical protein